MTLLENSRQGSQTPRLSSLPEGVASRAPGEAAIRLAESAGLHLDEWQQHVLREALGVRDDGRWAAFSTCVLVPRQNGKGAILEALAMAALFLFEVELVVWTAHEMKTAKEGFRRLVGHITSTPDLMRQVSAIKRGNDDRGIELRNGRRIQFLARSSGSGRGFTGDLVILDEAYELDGDVMAALLPTLSAVPNPQIWYTSSAPMAGSEQLHAVRKRGVEGDSSRLAFFEWSADPSLAPSSEEAWAQANPGYPHRIDYESIASEWGEFNADADPHMFCRERLGYPDEPAGNQSAIAPEVWAAAHDPGSAIVSHKSWALSVSPDRKFSSFGIAGRRADGRLHVETMIRKPGTAWVIEAASDFFAKSKIPLRIHKTGPEAAFIVPLTERKVTIVEVSAGEAAQATGQFIDAANGDQLKHLDQMSLNIALRGAALRESTDGAVVWSQRNSAVEISPLMAVTIAAGGVPAMKPKASAWVLVD